MKIGFVTCAADKLPYYFPTLAEPEWIPTEPPFTPDDQIAVNALRAQSHEVIPIVWGCPLDALCEFDLIIMRSPWDYMDNDDNKSRFMHWISELERAQIRVANPPKFMQWLLDKHYLQDMAGAGIAVIPTHYHEEGTSLDLLAYFKKQGQFVVKPCVSAAGMGLYHIKTMDDAIAHQEEINQRMQTGSYMRQDVIQEITTHGEWSLVFLGGVYSHALHKKPGVDSIMVHAERGGSLSFSHYPPQRVIDFAVAAYQKIFPAFRKAMQVECDPALVLYLRLDIIETSSGPVLIECEGVEPELFFRAKLGSEIIFCQRIAALA